MAKLVECDIAKCAADPSISRRVSRDKKEDCLVVAELFDLAI